MRRLLNILLILFVAAAAATAQRTPITITPVLTSPHPTSLEAMAERGSTSLMANIIVNDLTVSELPVRLHFKFQQGNTIIESIPNPVVTPMFLGAGEARTLFGADFAQYLKLDNLSFRGMSKEQYLRNGRLGDGLWKISIWAEHVHTGRTVSNTGSTIAWLSQCPPPELTSPREGVETPQHESEPLIFSWKPSKYTGGGAVMYRFEMWEMRIANIAPQTITAQIPPFYSTETAGTTITLPAGSVAVQPGLRYCWRVTAYDPAGKINFEKKGQSDVRTFKYLSECPPVEELNVNVIDYGSEVNFNWGFNEQHIKYNVELYSPDREFEYEQTYTDNDIHYYNHFEPETQWYVRVQGVCASGRTAKTSPEFYFEIPAKPVKEYADCVECVCEDPPAPRPTTNWEVRPLAKGDVFESRTGRTTYEVVSATQEADGESYRGLVYMNAPIWHCRFLLEYDHLKVNTDNIIIENTGHMKSVNSPLLASAKTIEDIEEQLGQLATNIAGATYNNRIEHYRYNSQQSVMAVFRDGDEYWAFDGEREINVTEQFGGSQNERMLFQDADGRQYVVNADGDVMSYEEYDKTGGEPLNIARRNAERDAQMHAPRQKQITFTRSDKQQYGFDAYDGSSESSQHYPRINDESQYRPAYVSAPVHTTDHVHTDAPVSYTFRNDGGTDFTIDEHNDVKFSSPGKPREAAIYAYDPEGEMAGKLNVLTFNEKEIKVHIVSVNDAKMPDIDNLQKEVNDIFRQAVVKVTIDALDPIEITFANGKSFVHGGTRRLRAYNDDQRAAIDQIKKRSEYNDNDYYLFYVDGAKKLDDDGNPLNDVLGGYMPVGWHFGFIYDNPTAPFVAHELGHGALGLHHTFSDESESFVAPRGTTQNLMDYAGGTALNHIQWQWAHENHGREWFGEERDGEFIGRLIAVYGASVSTNITLQMIFICMFDDDVNSIEEAWDKVDLIQALIDGGIDLIPIKKVRYSVSLAYNLVECLANKEHITIESFKECGLFGVLDIIAGEVIEQYGLPALKKGLQKIGFSKGEIDNAVKSFEDGASNNTKEINANIADRGEDLLETPVKKKVSDGDNQILNDLSDASDNRGKKYASKLELVNESQNWATFIGKNIDVLQTPPNGYQFYYSRNGKKFIRRIDASDVNTPQLTVKDGKIVLYDKKTIESYTKTLNRFETLAQNNEHLSALKKRITNLPDEGKQFIDDFADATDDVLKKFVDKPELVDSWKSLKDAGCKKEVYRNVAALELHQACKVGRELTPNAKVKNIHFGSNDKVVILGSGMQSRIEPAAEVLRKEGFSVELFNKECQTKLFEIDGESKMFIDLEKDFNDKLRDFSGGKRVNYTDTGAKDFFESTLMYKANEQFIKRIKDEDYTIIHIGQTTDSYFCDMENELIKDLNWIEKNLKWKE